MPGIAGLVSRQSAEMCRRTVAAMIDSMVRDAGCRVTTCEAPEMGAYAGGVAHPGSFAARESRAAAGGTLDLVMAGECVHDTSQSTAVLDGGNPQRGSDGLVARLYRQRDGDWVRELNGLFSGLLIDRSLGRTLLFNDRYGVERLYIHESEEGTYFASEAKALLRVVPALRAFDDEAVAQFLTFGCPLEGKTLFRGIRVLEGGSLWTFEREACRKQRYFTPSEWESQPTLGTGEFQEAFEGCFKRTLPRYVSDETRIGLSMTGGLDTRMILACMPPLETPPICYTFVGLRGETLDARISTSLAAECGWEHRLLRLMPEFLSRFSDHLDRTVYVTDGTAGPVLTHEIYLNEQARRLASVRLTGNYGSEVLRSASTFKRIGLAPEIVRPDFRPQMQAAGGNDLNRGEHPSRLPHSARFPGTSSASRRPRSLS